MSETAKQLFDSVKNVASALAPGLKELIPEVKAEFSRLATQGAQELAGALFNGNGFVPYGPGQYTPTPEHEAPSQESNEMHLERGGQER